MVDSTNGPGRKDGANKPPKTQRRRGLPRPKATAQTPQAEAPEKPTSKAPRPRKSAPEAVRRQSPAAPARPRKAKAPAPRATALVAPPAPAPMAATPVVAPPPDPQVRPLTEEEQIESAKYMPRDLPPRLFEEERFLFPDTYGMSRVRLLVKDPEWLFAHWDVDPASVASLRVSLGERTVALSQLTLRVTDPENGGASVVLLPNGTRSWYVRTDSARRAYRAELGMTLPSGEFHGIAWSNTVLTPRVGPSSEKADRVLTYAEAAAIRPESALEASAGEGRTGPSAGPWSVPPQMAAPGGSGPSSTGAVAGASAVRSAETLRGGASDLFRH